jgi:hypothetical protein
MKPSSVKIINAALVAGVGERHEPRDAKRTFQATGFTTAGAGAAAVSIQASNDGTNFLEIGTISLILGVAVTNDGFASDAPWRYIRAELVSISGTNAQATVWMGA